MDQNFQNLIKDATGAGSVSENNVIQSLWSGYGKIIRYNLKGCASNSVVVKHVCLPKNDRHPRGWNTDLSHQRKIKSYQVETAWYRDYSGLCNSDCRIPKCLALHTIGDEVVMVLEDLDFSGFPRRKSSVSLDELKACLLWLANFHATFIGVHPVNLWQIGTYWHLDTRPDELEVLSDKKLKKFAKAIDDKLNSCAFFTLVHGDAKLANFCFSEDGKQVAAVDFQYVGGGTGMKDVAYFIGSCLPEEDCERYESVLLDFYFEGLHKALRLKKKTLNVDALENEWRDLYPVAWTDFHRFLKGWSPGHWKINSYSERLAQEVIKQFTLK